MVQAILNQAVQEDLQTQFVRISRVSKHFGGKRVLTEVNLEVAEHELVVVVGRNGCGKSTLTWGEPPEQVAEKIAEVRRSAALYGRTMRFGVRLHLIVRETGKEAWAAAEDLIRYVTDDAISAAQKTYARFDSAGQRRMSQLHAGKREKLEISPILWTGVGLVRGGAGTALVGDPETVAERIREYADLGVDSFIFSGYPHLEEAYRVAELLFPLLETESELTEIAPQYLSPFGEVSTSFAERQGQSRLPARAS